MGRSATNYQFSMVANANIERSKFIRNRNIKTCFDAGWIIPFMVEEVVPGDTFSVHHNMLVRLLSPLKTPIMDNIMLDTFYFFGPDRLVWENYLAFMGEKEEGDPTQYFIPKVNINGASDQLSMVNGIPDYFGLPVGSNVTGTYQATAAPFRLYNLIYNKWFRDQNLEGSLEVPMDDGPDTLTHYQLMKRNKRHDYFTSCLKYPQKGPDVLLPLLEQAPVFGTGSALKFFDGTDRGVIGTNTGGGMLMGNAPRGESVAIGADFYLGGTFASGKALGLAEKGWYTDPEHSGAYADMSEATPISISDLRIAFQLQKFYEKLNRGGSRYKELLYAMFRVESPDQRLQWPEYLGGGSQRINVHSVQQTSATGGTGTPQGNLAAFGMSFGGAGFTKAFVEHGWILGLLSVRADMTYQYGIHKMWSRKTREDLYWPSFAHLSEQAVKRREIYCKGTYVASPYDEGSDEVVFGYQERYAEFKYGVNLVTSWFRSNHPQTLHTWHLAQEFTDYPTLNNLFMEENPPIDRVIAVPGTEQAPLPQFMADIFIEMTCARPMPMFGTPGFTDHF